MSIAIRKEIKNWQPHNVVSPPDFTFSENCVKKTDECIDM